MKNFIYWMSVLLFIFNSQTSSGYVFHQRDIPDSTVLEETGEIIYLRGVGLCKAYFQDLYIGAFYSNLGVTTAQQALEDKGAKRMGFYFLQSYNRLPTLLKEYIENNNSPEMLQKQQIDISLFLKMVNVPVNKGDVMVFEYIPNIGTKVMIRGNLKGIVKSNEFYNLILKGWIGRQPPSEKFKNDLFNLSGGIHLLQLSG